MLNFEATVAESEAHPNFEVDSWRWYKITEACAAVKPGGLAERLLEDLRIEMDYSEREAKI